MERARKSGYVRVKIDGNMYELSEEIKLDKNIKHNIEDCCRPSGSKRGIEQRLTDSIENVLNLAEGLMTVDVIGGESRFSSVKAFHVLIAESVLKRLNREAFRSTIRLAHARNALDWDTRWNLMKI